MNTIELDDEQAALFILFMKHYDTIGFMISQGVFDLKSGNALLHFGTEGELEKIKIETFHSKSYQHPVTGQASGLNIKVVV